MMKDNKGISLLSLIIVIIVIVIIAAISLDSGFNKNIEEATFSKVYNELLEVESAVSQRGYEHKFDPSVYPYEGSKEYTNATPITINNMTYGDDYYLLTAKDLENLGVTSASRDYVVNYTTGDVVLKEAFYWHEKKVYNKKDMLEVYTNNAVISQAEYDEKQGVNKPLLLDGMLPVKYNGSYWFVTSLNDDEWYDYSLDSSGGPLRYANVMLMDDTKVKDGSGKILSNEKLRGMNIDNLVGMQIVEEGSMFVWIPRYTYKTESDGSLSIVYSNLTKDYVSNGYTKNPAFYLGEYAGANSTEETNTGYIVGGKELTGIWISKYEAGYIN